MTLAIAKKQAPDSTSKAKRDGARSAQTNSPQGRGSFPVPFIQRKPTCACGGGCPRCKEHAGPPELKIDQPGDKHEQEADRIADRVMQVRDPQRLEKPLILQRRATHHAEPAMVPPIVQEVLRSPGQPLDPATRAFMEPHFGHDFSQVRVHTDARSAESAKALGARAYTVSRDIVFAAGQYAPGSEIGRRLLTHELVHTMQQEGGAVRVQRAAGPTAGGCAAEGDTVDEQRDEASWAGHIAHMQIQGHFFPTLDIEAELPRATKENRDPSCPRSGTREGKIDLWHYDGAGGAQIGEIKSIHGAKYAAPEVNHYNIRFEQLVSRMTGGKLCRDAADQADVFFDGAWLNGDLANDRRVPKARPLDSIVPAVTTVIGDFWLDWDKELRCKRLPGGGVVYWCNKKKKHDEEQREKEWQLAEEGLLLWLEATEHFSRHREKKAPEKKQPPKEAPEKKQPPKEAPEKKQPPKKRPPKTPPSPRAKLGSLGFRLLLPGPQDALMLMVRFAGSYAEAHEAIRSRNTRTGFAIGLSANLLGRSFGLVSEHFWRERVLDIEVHTQVLGAVGMAEKAHNAGLGAGFNYGGLLSDEAKDALREIGFSALAAQGRLPESWQEMRAAGGVARLAGALLPAVDQIFEAMRVQAEREKRAQEAQEARERYERGETGGGLRFE